MTTRRCCSLAGRFRTGPGQCHQVCDGAVRSGYRRPGRDPVIAEKHGVKAALGRAGYIAASLTGLVAVPSWLLAARSTWPASCTRRSRGRRSNPPRWSSRIRRMGGPRLRPRRAGVIICWRRRDQTQTAHLAVLAAAGSWPRWNRRASTPLPHCTSTSISGRGSRLPPPGTRWLSSRGSAAADSLALRRPGWPRPAMRAGRRDRRPQAEQLFQEWPKSTVTASQLRSLHPDISGELPG